MRDFHKMKLLCLLEILKQQTDEGHGISMPELIQQLELYGIAAERKSIYRDIEALNSFGGQYSVEKRKTVGGQTYYYLKGKSFQLEEIKFLTDAVQASAALGAQESDVLQRKLEGLLSRREAKMLRLQSGLFAPLKAPQEGQLEKLRLLVLAIQEQRAVRFRRQRWNARRQLSPVTEEAPCLIWPQRLRLDGDTYWLYAYMAEAEQTLTGRTARTGKAGVSECGTDAGAERTDRAEHEVKAAAQSTLPLKRFRLSHMTQLSLLDERETKKLIERCGGRAMRTEAVSGELSESGQRIMLRLRCGEKALGTLLDRFGAELRVLASDKEGYELGLRTALRPEQLLWLAALPGVLLLGPEALCAQLAGLGEYLSRRYSDRDSE